MHAVKSIIQRTIPPILVPPFMIDDSVYDALAETPRLEADMTSPLRERYT